MSVIHDSESFVANATQSRRGGTSATQSPTRTNCKTLLPGKRPGSVRQDMGRDALGHWILFVGAAAFLTAVIIGVTP